MGVFKHSPGCGCCGCAWCISAAPTIDLVVPAASTNSGDCTDCDFSGTYTLTHTESLQGGYKNLVAPTGDVCYWEGSFSESIDCAEGGTIWIAIIAEVDVDELRIVITDEDNVSSAAELKGSLSPSTWFDDEDCTANLEVTVSAFNSDLDVFWNCTGFPFGSCCRFSDGDVFELNP